MLMWPLKIKNSILRSKSSKLPEGADSSIQETHLEHGKPRTKGALALEGKEITVHTMELSLFFLSL